MSSSKPNYNHDSNNSNSNSNNDDEYFSSDDESIYDGGSNSKVVLGFVDAPITADDQPSIEDTFIGGQPVWLHPDSKPDEQYLICNHCNKKMALLSQAFAPIDGILYDRVLYIFGCKNPGCSRQKGSVKVIRGIDKSAETVSRIKSELEDAKAKELDEKLKLDNKKQLNQELMKDLFKKPDAESSQGGVTNPFGAQNPFAKSGDKDSNPFGSNPFAKPEENKSNDLQSMTTQQKKQEAAMEKVTKPVSKSKPTKENEQPKESQSFAEVVAQNAPKQVETKVKTLEGDLPEYIGNFVFVEPEKFKKDKTSDAELAKYKHLIEKNNSEGNGNGNGSGGGGDDDDDIFGLGGGMSSRRGSQSSAVLDPQTQGISNMLDDKYFENFSSTVKHNPGQVLRYDLHGRPLLYNGKDDVAKRFLVNPPNIPRPGYNPSSERRFELQLMPKAIMDLEGLDIDGDEKEGRDNSKVDIKDILNGMSWGTIIVCTDVEDYIPDDRFDENGVAYIEEWCGVQWEESV